MTKMTWREKRYRAQKLNCVRHITLDPKGPGVLRMHLIPPGTDSASDPFLLLLNGAQLVPLNLSWAVLLTCFMDQLESSVGRELEEKDWQAMAQTAARQARKVYPGTTLAQLQEELSLMMESLLDIAQHREPEAEVEVLSLGEYADKMTAPHRMDLMVSAMTREGNWHCNQKCLHCYAAGQPMGETAELDTETWKQLLKKLRQANIPQVTFTGGEPTMRDDLVELVEAAQWFVTRLNTNGRLLTKELCGRLYEASLDSVQVTLYSAEETVHNTLVGAPGYQDTIAGIGNAVEAGLIVSINTPLCSLNRNYADTLRLAHSMGVRYATCSGLIPSGGAAGEESMATRLSAEELEQILREAVEVTRELGMELDFTSPGWLAEDILRGMGLQLVPSCGACLSNMAVTPDGKVVPCQSWLGGVTLGDLQTDSWSTIWNHAACAEIRAESAKMEHICQLRSGNVQKEGC
ncbi:MAG: radical SAM protein [Ruminococcaceae bacterium]|nr:radical SAM protein [Oscillospiraceae bacterium]